MCNRSFFSGDLQRSVLNITAHYRSRLREDFDESGGSVVTAPRAQKEISAKRYSNFSVAFSSSHTRTFGLDNKSINNENSNICNFVHFFSSFIYPQQYSSEVKQSKLFKVWMLDWKVEKMYTFDPKSHNLDNYGYECFRVTYFIFISRVLKSKETCAYKITIIKVKYSRHFILLYVRSFIFDHNNSLIEPRHNM